MQKSGRGLNKQDMIAKICGWLVVTIAILAVIGHVYGIGILKTILPSRIEIRFYTAINFVIAGMALLLLAYCEQNRACK